MLKGSYIDTASRKNQAERCIKTAAKIISPAIENTFAAGYDWYVLGFIVNLLLNFEAVALDINTRVLKYNIYVLSLLHLPLVFWKLPVKQFKFLIRYTREVVGLKYFKVKMRKE